MAGKLRLRSEQRYHAEGVEERYAFPSVNGRVVFFYEKSPPLRAIDRQNCVCTLSVPTGNRKPKKDFCPLVVPSIIQAQTASLIHEGRFHHPLKLPR